MSDSSETDNLSRNFSQSSREDSGIHSSYGGSTDIEEQLKGNQENSQASCSDLLAELLQKQKKMNEVETQVRSLSLILDYNDVESGAGINHTIFQENKHSLEREIMQLKKDISDKETVLQKMDVRLFKRYLESLKDEANSQTSSQNRQNIISMNGEDSSSERIEIGAELRSTAKINEGDSSSVNVESQTFPDRFENMNKSLKNGQDFEIGVDKDFEIAKLRRTLVETRQKHKEERDDIMKELKSLQLTTVQGETNWECVVKEKQLKIEELTRKNHELERKNAEVDFSFKNCEKLRQTEAKEANKRKGKNEKIILSLRTQISRSKEKINQLLSEVEELRNIKEGRESLKQLSELNEKLEKDLCDNIRLLDQKNQLIQEYAKEIKETNILVNNLIIEVNNLNTDKTNLTKEVEEVKAQNLKKSNFGNNTLEEEQLEIDNRRFVHVGIQTEGNERQLKNEFQKMKAELESKEAADNLHLAEQLMELESFVERLKENEMKLETESDRWKNRSLENER